MNFNKILIISTHYDDETFGCGGTIKKFIKAGKQVYLLTISDPSGYVFDKRKLKVRYDEIKKIKSFYKFKKTYDLNYPASKIYEINKSEFFYKVKLILDKIKPDTIFLNFYNDAHSDHRIVFDNLRFMMKPFRFKYIKNILMMEIISETDQGYSLIKDSFKPNFFIDISKQIKDKIKAVKIFKSQLSKSPFPRNPEIVLSLAKIRGSQSNYDYAEAFMVLKMSVD